MTRRELAKRIHAELQDLLCLNAPWAVEISAFVKPLAYLRRERWTGSDLVLAARSEKSISHFRVADVDWAYLFLMEFSLRLPPEMLPRDAAFTTRSLLLKQEIAARHASQIWVNTPCERAVAVWDEVRLSGAFGSKYIKGMGDDHE